MQVRIIFEPIFSQPSLRSLLFYGEYFQYSQRNIEHSPDGERTVIPEPGIDMFSVTRHFRSNHARMGNVVCLQNVQQVVQLVLQGIGKFVRAQDIVEYVDRPAVKERLKLKKTISLATAQRWMKTVGYRWTKTPTGQFVDGHERDNVVAYRQTVFLPI